MHAWEVAGWREDNFIWDARSTKTGKENWRCNCRESDDDLSQLRKLELLADHGSIYDYVTVTDTLQRDAENYFCGKLPGFEWNSEIVKEGEIGETNYSGRVEIKTSEQIKELKLKSTKEGDVREGMEVKEMCRILQQKHNASVVGMVIYKECVYTVNQKDFTVYCYKRNGSFISKYEHEGGGDTVIEGMCLMMSGNTPMLVVSVYSKRKLVWIQINGTTMDHHHTQHLDYTPYQSYNDIGQLVVCGNSNMIHRYSCAGQSLEVISLPGDVRP